METDVIVVPVRHGGTDQHLSTMAEIVALALDYPDAAGVVIRGAVDAAASELCPDHTIGALIMAVGVYQAIGITGDELRKFAGELATHDDDDTHATVDAPKTDTMPYAAKHSTD